MEKLPIEDSVVMENVTNALKEDVGDGDITANLIDASTQLKARVITRERAVIAGQRWVNSVFAILDKNVVINWNVNDGEEVEPNQTLFTISGPARSILTGERTALNFLQLLSATATTTNQYVERISHTSCRLLDTRKTIPGLRLAQKYAVTCGGGKNHRKGLYDAFLIKENHIAACGGISEFLKICALASTFGVTIIPHVWGSAVGLAAGLHAVAALPLSPFTANPIYLENEVC